MILNFFIYIDNFFSKTRKIFIFSNIYYFNNIVFLSNICFFRYNGLITRFDYNIWLIHQGKINLIFHLFILKSYMSHFQLSTFFTTIISTLLLPLLFILYQVGYNLINTKFFLEEKSYLFFKTSAK